MNPCFNRGHTNVEREGGSQPGLTLSARLLGPLKQLQLINLLQASLAGSALFARLKKPGERTKTRRISGCRFLILSWGGSYECFGYVRIYQFILQGFGCIDLALKSTSVVFTRLAGHFVDCGPTENFYIRQECAPSFLQKSRVQRRSPVCLTSPSRTRVRGSNQPRPKNPDEVPNWLAPDRSEYDLKRLDPTWLVSSWDPCALRLGKLECARSAKPKLPCFNEALCCLA